MNARQLLYLSIAALVIIVAAIWIGHARGPTSTEAASLYPDLKDKLATVTAITVRKGGDQVAATLTLADAKWRLKERSNYAADSGKVNSLLINLENAKLREQKTANPANYAALGVQDVSDASASGVRVELTGAPSKIDLIVGRRDPATRTTF